MEAFTKHLFTPEQLEAELRAAVRLYLQDVRAIENLMLVKIRQDLDDLPPVLLVVQMEPQCFERFFRDAMDTAATRTGAGLRDSAIQEIVSLVVGDVATVVAVRLGVSAGILGAGGASTG